MVAIKNKDLATTLLWLLHDQMPATLQPWSQAMLGELSMIDGFWPRLEWSLGGAVALLLASQGSQCRRTESGRLDVPLVAGYQFLFSALLIGALTWQLPRLTESWRYAVPALIMCYGIATLPAVLGFALLLRDEAARIATIVFSIAHLLLNLEYIRRGIAPHPAMTGARIAVDLLIILALSRRPVRRQFQLSLQALHLLDESPDPAEHPIGISGM